MLKDKLDLRARAGGVKVFPAEEARCAKAWGQGFFWRRSGRPQGPQCLEEMKAKPRSRSGSVCRMQKAVEIGWAFSLHSLRNHGRFLKYGTMGWILF